MYSLGGRVMEDYSWNVRARTDSEIISSAALLYR